jgi:hypothetical protein
VHNAALDQALALWRRGLSVIPIPAPRPGVPAGRPGDGKVPAIAWREFQDRRATEDEIRVWFRTPQNIAVVTGAVSGVVVIDADDAAAVQWCIHRLPYTPWQTQTARGFHLWYQHPGVRVGNRAQLDTGAGRLAVDVRGDGGFVIAPGSIHASGYVYRGAGDWTRLCAELPRFWRGWLQRPKPATALRSPATLPAGDVIERARKYLASIRPPTIGAASDVQTLSAACRLVRGFALSETDAIALLWEWAGGRPGWTRAWIADKVAHAMRYGTEPIGGLR